MSPMHAQQSHLTKTVQKQATKLSLRPRPNCTQWVEPADLRCKVGFPVSVCPRRAELLGLSHNATEELEIPKLVCSTGKCSALGPLKASHLSGAQALS